MSRLNQGLVRSRFVVGYFPIIFLLFFLHPYYVLFIATLLSLFLRPDKFFVPLSFSLAIAFFLTSRTYGVIWSTGGDDLAQWLKVFNGDHYSSVFELLAAPVETSLKNNEPIFYFFTLILGSITSIEQVYVFVNYFLIVFLVFCAARLTSKDKYLYLVFLFFFGVGSFAEGPLLHLWRQTYASLFVYIAVICFWKHWKIFWVIGSVAVFTHLAAIFFLVYRIFFKFTPRLNLLYPVLNILIFTSLLTVLVSAVDEISIFIFGFNIAGSYFGMETPSGRGHITIGLLCFLFIYFYRRKIGDRETFIVSTTASLGALTLLMPDAGGFIARYSTFLTPFLIFLLFSVLIKLPKIINFICIPILFAWKFGSQGNSEMINAMYGAYTAPFQGVLLRF